MNYLYAPWRDTYTKEEQSTERKECIFCKQIAEHDDKKYFIIQRYEHGLVMLNLYPYNPGHLLIIPYRHTANLVNLSSPERSEMMDIIATTSNVLQTTLKANGINVGLNMGGKAAGGSV